MVFLLVVRCTGITTQDLIKFYTTFVRPVVEYAAPLWHPSISKKVSNRLEEVEHSSLRTVFSDISYRQADNILIFRPLDRRIR